MLIELGENHPLTPALFFDDRAMLATPFPATTFSMWYFFIRIGPVHLRLKIHIVIVRDIEMTILESISCERRFVEATRLY